MQRGSRHYLYIFQALDVGSIIFGLLYWVVKAVLLAST